MTGYDDLQRRFAAISSGQATRKLMGELGLLAVAEAKSLVPRKTGNLGRTIRVDRVTADSVTITAGGRRGIGYAKPVEYGTRAHTIVPRNKKVLAWGGSRRLSGSLRSGAKAQFFAKRVRHPGTRAKPYLRPGAAQALQRAGLAKMVVNAWNEAA
jgi:hypothetical protein